MSSAMEIDVELVRRLIESQFPDWADLPIEKVEPNGWDNRTFRLGTEMSVRLPSHERYSPQVEKEQEWLPKLGARLPLPIPTPLARGGPGHGYAWHWSVNRWLPGETAETGRIDDPADFASELARFLRALHEVDAVGGPGPGTHNFHRGGSPAVYDAEVRKAIDRLGDEIDRAAVTDVWEAGQRSAWDRPPVWIHGDLVPSNTLVHEGRLSAVIDFGCSGIGDPACDLPIQWLFFSGRSREVFREQTRLDDATWARGRAWTLWKRLVSLAGDPTDTYSRQVIDAVVAEHEAEA